MSMELLEETTVDRRPRQHYTEAEVETALTIMAMAGGNQRRAALEYEKLTGHPIDNGMLWRWANELHAERYDELKVQLGDKLADLSEAVALKANDLALETLQRIDSKIDEIPARDLSTTFRNLAVGAGVGTDKSLVLRGRPNQITETRDAASLLRKLAAVGIIEGSAEDEEEHEAIEAAS